MKTDFILARFRRPVRAPDWWEGHTIWYKAYLVKGGIGLCTLNLCARDGGRQRQAPWSIGQIVKPIVGGKRMEGQGISRVRGSTVRWFKVQSSLSQPSQPSTLNHQLR